MTTKLYFETLSPGLRARLDARYRMNRKPHQLFRPSFGRGRLEAGGLVPPAVEFLQTPALPAR
jgi:hypothetical protein